MNIRILCALALALASVSTTAMAQSPKPGPKLPAAPAPATASSIVAAGDYVEQRVDGNQVVTFPGDALQGDENSAYGFTVRRPPGVLRAGLIRPRVNFVSELLKSVENL